MSMDRPRGVADEDIGESVSSENESSSVEINTGIDDEGKEQPQPGRENEQQERGQEDVQKTQDMFRKTQAVDDLLKREMMQLSLQARNDIQEEIHGVKCLAVEETEVLLRTALTELDAQLNMILQLSTSIPNLSASSLLLAKNLGSESYANTVEFKLRFLRTEFFDVQKAAVRMCAYLYRIHTLFGDFALGRELYLHKDFTKEELKEFRKAFFQFLPFRDRSGRRILMCFPNEDMENVELELLAKFICYLATMAAANDVETQRNGIVIVVWFDSTYKIPPIQLPRRQSPLEDYGSWGCVRVSAMHVCTPDTPFFRFRRSIMALRANQNQRSRLKLHVGEPVELRYILQGYGIPTENIPVTWSGTIKNLYFKNWMKLRKAIEDDYEARREHIRQLQRQGFQSVSDRNHGYNSTMALVVECPNSNDVVFRQGTSLLCHPGNARFRSLVESSVVKLRETKPAPTKSGDESPSSSIQQVSTLVSEIISKIIHQNKGRVLVWTSNHNGEKYGCWCIITNENQIYSKIEYIVREHIRGAGGGGTASQAVAVSKAEKQKSNLQTSESSTSIFLGTTATAASMPNKRARISNNDDRDSGHSSSDDDSCQLFCKK